MKSHGRVLGAERMDPEDEKIIEKNAKNQKKMALFDNIDPGRVKKSN